MGTAALGSVHGTEMEEIILGVVCTKSRLAVCPVWFSWVDVHSPSGSSTIANELVSNQCLVVWLHVLVLLLQCFL